MAIPLIHRTTVQVALACLMCGKPARVTRKVTGQVDAQQVGGSCGNEDLSMLQIEIQVVDANSWARAGHTPRLQTEPHLQKPF